MNSEIFSNIQAKFVEKIKQVFGVEKEKKNPVVEEDTKENNTNTSRTDNVSKLNTENNGNDQILSVDTKEQISREPSSYKPLVVVGPSGVGKGTLLEYLTKKFNNTFVRAVSHTTRGKRQNEVDGVHYHFVTKDEFEKKIQQNCFLEFANIHGNMYGTSFQSIKDVESKKQICILEKDFQGAVAIKNANIDANYIFITCDGQIKTLHQRLKGRQTESDEQINNRLKTAEIEFDFLNKNPTFFNYVLSNDDLKKSQTEMTDLLLNWYPCLQGGCDQN